MNINGTSHQSVIPRDRAAFLHLMRMWFVQTGRTSDMIPRMGERPIDLHQLYIEVENLGGLEKVQATGLWRLVAIKMGCTAHDQNDPQLWQTAQVLADAYAALLVPFENFCLERIRTATNTNGTSHQHVIPHDWTTFLHLMRMWFVQTGRTLDAIPQIGERPVDLHRLYIEVETLGGLEKVQVAGLWRLVAVKMGCSTHDQNDPQLWQTAQLLADAYVALLVPFNSFCLERMRAAGAVSNNPLNLGSSQPATSGGPASGPGAVHSGDNETDSMANFQRILAFLQVTLKDWLPEQSVQVKFLHASQMDEQEMRVQGWPLDMIATVRRFQPALLHYRAMFIRQQEQERQVAQAQVYQQQPQPSQQLHVGDRQPEVDIQEFERHHGVGN